MKQIIVDNISTNYYITKEGKCYNNKTNKFLKGQLSKNGYITYNITLPNGTNKRLYAWKLLEEYFGINENNTIIYCFNKNKELVAKYLSIVEAAKAVGCSKSIINQEVNKDIKTLSGGFYWSKERTLGETKNYPNLGKAKEVCQYDLKGKYIMKYESTGQAARALGIKSSSHIGECCRGKIPTYKNFIWRYAEDIVSTSNEN